MRLQVLAHEQYAGSVFLVKAYLLYEANVSPAVLAGRLNDFAQLLFRLFASCAVFCQLPTRWQ